MQVTDAQHTWAITDYTWIVLPVFMYFITTALTVAIRRDIAYLFTRDVPRVGPEACKIACSVMLGAIILGIDSGPFRGSLLAKTPGSHVWATLGVMSFLAFFVGSYACFHAIEGKRVWRKEIGKLHWLGGFLGCLLLGIAPLVAVILALKGSG